METFVIVAYCASDDAVKKLKIQDNVQTNVSTAQIMTTGLVAARFFQGNHDLAQKFLYEHKYFNHRLSKSQFNRRFHAMPDALFDELIMYFGNYAKITNESFEFAIDSFPISACENIRIQRSKLFDPKSHRGFIASKRTFFHGVRVHMIASLRRQPVEFRVLPGTENDTSAARKLDFNLPPGSIVYGDKAYGDYKLEDRLKCEKNIELMPVRKKNSLRTRSHQEEYVVRRKRKSIETTFSLITKLIPKTIHAVTQAGFLRKVFCFILSFSANFLVVTT